jgi:hypothetical protein
MARQGLFVVLWTWIARRSLSDGGTYRTVVLTKFADQHTLGDNGH